MVTRFKSQLEAGQLTIYKVLQWKLTQDNLEQIYLAIDRIEKAWT